MISNGTSIKKENINKLKLTGLSLAPVAFLYGGFFQNVGIRTSALILLIFFLLLGYTCKSIKIYTNIIIIQFLLLFIYGTILFFRGGYTPYKVDCYKSLMLSFIISVSIYYYALHTNRFHFEYYLFIYVCISFVISLLEMNYGLILPTSGKYILEGYRHSFNRIPTSTYFNPNDFATAIGMVFVYLFSYNAILRKIKRNIIILLFCLYIVYYTKSRGVQLSILLLPFVYSLVNRKSIKKLLFFYSFFCILFIFLYIGNIKILGFEKYYDVINSFISGKGLVPSDLYRWEIIRYTLQNIKLLLIGYGPGGSSLFLEYLYIKNPHNFFIEILIDYGILGLIFSLAIFYTSLKINYILCKQIIPKYLLASCKSTIILIYHFMLFSVVSSSLLYGMMGWFPIYLTLINLGTYSRTNKLNIYLMREI
jgi:hypothetical protein